MTAALSRAEMIRKMELWLDAWDKHHLDGVLELMHNDVIFENWDGTIVHGKTALRKAWLLWFLNHGNFKFSNEDIFIDEKEQKLLFRWKLEWPSLEKRHLGKAEVRRGVDVIHFKDGKIIVKISYSKTQIYIDNEPVFLNA
jgi:hypothetical protein